MSEEQFSMWDILGLACATLYFVVAIWPDCDCQHAINAMKEVQP